MYACVKVVHPGAAVTTETISGIVDATTGTSFAVRTIVRLSGNTANDILTYWGLADSSYHWDCGFMHDASQGSGGGGICGDFSLKIGSGADGYGYAFMDTWPDIFFGGYIGGYGYVHNVVAGAFDITWVRRDRGGDAMIILCVGGTDYDIDLVQGSVNGTYAAATPPQGLLNFYSVVGTAGSGPAVTGAGGTGWYMGWDTKDGIRGAATNTSGSQGGVSREQWTDRYNDVGAHVTAWTDSSYTIAGASGGGGLRMVFRGADVVVKAGSFSAPATDSSYSFNAGVNAKFIIFQTVGLPEASLGVADTTRASLCVGMADGTSQASYWTGDTTIGNVMPLYGTRYLSSTQVIRTATAAGSHGATTAFSNLGVVTHMDAAGDVTVEFTATDGAVPHINWFAVGTEVLNPPSVTIRKVWTGDVGGQAIIQIGTTVGNDDITSLETGPNGTEPLSIGPVEIDNDVPYYASETDPGTDWEASYGILVNDSPGSFTNETTHEFIADVGEDIIITITNTKVPPPTRPKQWKLYRFDVKPTKAETS